MIRDYNIETNTDVGKYILNETFGSSFSRNKRNHFWMNLYDYGESDLPYQQTDRNSR